MRLFIRCEGCLKKEDLFMCFTTEKKKEVYLCHTCLGKALMEDSTKMNIYSMNKLGYTWKKAQVIKKT